MQEKKQVNVSNNYIWAERKEERGDFKVFLNMSKII